MCGMKQLTLLLLVALTTLMAQAQKAEAAKREGPWIELVNYKWNVGKFSKAKTPCRGAVYPVKNVGNAPLIIEKVNPHCGCLRVDWTRGPIAPGATGYVKVVYDGRDQLPHYFNKQAVINTNIPYPSQFVYLTLEGEMTE